MWSHGSSFAILVHLGAVRLKFHISHVSEHLSSNETDRPRLSATCKFGHQLAILVKSLSFWDNTENKNHLLAKCIYETSSGRFPGLAVSPLVLF